MRRSEKVIELLTAVNEAKMQIRSLEKNKKNPHYKSEYADINQVFDVIKRPLYDNGVALNQFPDIVNGQFVLTTVLTHLKSGEFIETDFVLLLEKQTSQGQGSALTYAKRLSISTLLSLYEFDDDGNSAENPPSESKDPSKKDTLLPEETHTSIVNKYITLHKLDRNDVRVKTIYHEARKMPVANVEEFVKKAFKELT